jgi:hypothetical protein
MSPSVVSDEAEVQSKSKRRGYLKLGIATVFSAVLANVLVYFLGDVVVDYKSDFVILNNFSGVAIFTFVAAVVAVLLYAVLLRKSVQPERTFTITAAVLLVLSVIPDLTMLPGEKGSSNGQIALLVLSHIVAAVIITGMLTKYGRNTQSRTS